ncbi:hypothetical protein P879_03358 [Paragonimus westermani]|uniref:HSA domain-containing protein n=1 Tax=Paragonimus westermani TaxID=34504 RepID=A0A8T0DE58_9TREM|nr:hypothetical protein P879_03358 [Paragonimus westermani]
MWNTDSSCSPPPKKYRAESDCVVEELSKICSVQKEQRRLDLINKELDSLDDSDVFFRAHVRPDLKNPTCTNGFGNGVLSVVPPLATLFPNQRTSERHCLYLAPPDNVCSTNVQQSKVEAPTEQPIQSHLIRPEIAQDARLEATVLQQVTELRRRGMWSAARLPKVMEPKPEKTLFGCLLKEVSWMSADFKEERKWKIQMAYNLAVAARNYLLVRQEWNRQCQLVEELVRQRNAAYVAAMIRDWWKQIQKSLKCLEDRVHRQHLRYIRNQNKFLLANFSDLCPSWMVEHYATSPYVDCEPGATRIGSDGFTDDGDWLPDSLSVESDGNDSHSRSTSSSRAASFVDDSDTSVFGITELRSGDGDTAPHISEPCSSYQSIRESEPNAQHINTAVQTVQEKIETGGVGRRHTVNDSEKFKPESDRTGTSTPHCVDRAELDALVLDSETPLEEILQSRRRFDKRTTCLLPESWRRAFASYGLDETKDVTQFQTVTSNPELEELIADSQRPLEELLPEGYTSLGDVVQDNSTNSTLTSELYPPDCTPDSPTCCHKSTVVDNLQTTDGVQSYTLSDSSANSVNEVSLVDKDESANYGDETVTGPITLGRQAEDEMGLTIPPWGDYTTNLSQRTHPAELRWAAVRLLPLLKSVHLNADNSGLEALTTVCPRAVLNPPNVLFIQTDRFYFPPGCVVAWLRHAFARGVPGLLISPSAISGDAELTIAAHLGHLIVPGARYVEPSDVFPASKPLLQGETGDWGPHLIVAPRLCIPAWRARLSNWCPGLRITCLGLGCRGAKFPSCEPAGTGRRLRSAVTRGTVNVCITSYAAIFARPSRYSRIRWSVIVLDQIHHILPCSDVSQTLSEGVTDGDSVTKNIHLDHPSGQLTRREVSKSGSITASNGIDTLISELKYSGHRLLISSSPDLLSSACGYRLFELSRLLLSRDAANTDECKSWTTELFDTIIDSGWSNPNQHVNNGRPSKKKLIKFLEPFVLRLDEDYEWEASISEEIVPCHMTAVQRQLHDAAMSTKTARNASKTGDLLGLLSTVSLTSRICNHPCLSETRPQHSAAFADVMSDLASRIVPKPGPFAFTVAHNEAPFCASGLLYSTPESVLSAVRRLRDSELSEITLQGFNLLDSLKEPFHIRERVAVLAPTKKQFERVIIPTSIKRPHPKPPPVFNCDTPNGGMDYDSVYPPDCLNGQDTPFSHSIKANCRLANGLPESTVHLDFSTITVRAKRPRVMSELPNSIPQPPTKRHRPDDLGPVDDFTCDRKVVPVLANGVPFLGPEVLATLEKMLLEKQGALFGTRKTNTSLVNFAARFGADPLPDDGLVNNEPSTLSQSISFNPSIRLESLVSDNDRRCKQLVGFSDWCSEAIVSSFDFCCPSKMSPLHLFAKPFGWCAAQHAELRLPIWNLPSVFLSQLPYSSLLCSRSRVVASSPRLTSLRHPGLFHTHACDTLHNEAIEVSCATRSSSPYTSRDLLHFSSTLSSALSSVYRFTEQARWLSPIVPYLSCNQRCNIIAAFNGSALTPLGRIFLASGKFQGLHHLLKGLLGPHSSCRPRCIFLLAHRSAFLDLLQAYLDVSPWSSYARFRLPSDYNILGAESGQLIDRINDWPRGSHGPLLVLVHSRSPTACLTGLRAGPNTAVIVCDADWRSDSIDTLRALLHSWSLNGLVDHPKLDNADLSRTTLPVYRLVSFDDCVRPGLCPSVEACIARGVACRLLPGAVFQAHSITSSDRQSLTVARVQPNVVNELLSCQLPAENRLSSFRVDPLWTLKREAPSCSSASSVTSSFSCPVGGESRREKNGDLADECFSTFQEREPLCEQLLNRAFELFEDPVDTQAWCCAIAEQTAIALTIFNDFCVDECESSFSDDDSDHFHVQPADVFLNGELCGYNFTPDRSGLQQQLGYSETTCWEVAHQEACRYLDSLNAWSAESPAMFYSDVNIDRRSSFTDLSSHDTLLNNWTPENPLCCLCDIPIWNPLLDEHSQNERSPLPPAKAVFSLSDDDGPDLHWTSAQLAPTEPRSSDISPGDADCSDWGYESEPMSEHELPPVTHLPVVSVSSASSVTAPSVSNGQSLRPDDTAHSTTDNEPSGHSRVTIGSNNVGARSSLTGPYLKRRRLTGSTLHTPRKSMSAALDTRIPVTEDDSHSSPVTVAGESDASMTPSPSTPHKNIGRDPSLLSGNAVTQVAPLNSPGATAQSGSGTNASSVGPGSTFLLSLHPHGSSTSNGPKLHIPRASYNREMVNMRSNRMRRLNAVQSTAAATATGVNAAVVGAHFSAQQMTKTSPYHGQSGNLTLGNASPFSNPPSLARYSHTSPGRQLHSVQGNQSTSFRYNGGTSVVVPCSLGGANNLVGLMANTSGNMVPGGHLHIGKPPEWLPQEEAALYQSICKLQDTSFDATATGNSNSVFSPNFHLAEFFINNFFPTRCYRGASQCLLMHAKMSAVASTATAAMASSACNLLQTTGIIPMDDASVAASPMSVPATPHGPTSRKVKNKLKSAAASNLGLGASTGSLTSRNDGQPIGEINADASSAVSKYRTYLAYQTLQSANNLEGSLSNTDSGTSNSGTDSTASLLPSHLSQLFNSIRVNDESQSRILKKTIKDSLFTSPIVHSIPFHRPPTSRRQVLTGFSGSQGTGSPASVYHTGATGSSTSLYNYSHSTLPVSGSFLTTQTGHTTHTSTAPALLNHHRIRHDHLSGPQIGVSSSSCSGEMTGSGQMGLTVSSLSSSSHSGPIIQKNPTHIAALQEHNINPDTLITPAMVIKNKEEREARMLAEAVSSVSQSCPSSSVVCSSVTAVTSSTYHQSSGTGPHHTQLNIHPQDGMHHPSVLLSLPLDCTASASGIVATTSLPLNLTGSNLSFTHAGQRGTSFVTIVSSNPTMLRRSATFTSVNLNNQFLDSSLSARLSSLQPNQTQTAMVGLSGSTINTQVSKGPMPTSYFLQQRPQLLTTNQPISTRGIFTTLASISSSASLPVAGGFGSSTTPLPQILRPRSTLRGSVIQPNFVRNLTPTNVSNFPINPVGARLSPGTGTFLHSRVTLTVPPNSSTLSNTVGSRSGISTGLRTQSSNIYQQVRSVGQIAGNVQNVTYSGQLTVGELRPFNPLQGPQTSQFTPSVGVSSPLNTMAGSSRFESASNRHSESDPFVQSRFRPQPAP